MMKNNQSGQSTIEFIITFVFGLSIILMIFVSAINYASGYLVHYATFMASRTILTGDNHAGTIQNVAASHSNLVEYGTKAFNKFRLDILKLKDLTFKVNPPVPGGDASSYLMVGAVTTFKQKLDISKRITGGRMLELTSESFLGVEPTRAACAQRVCQGIKGISGDAVCGSVDDITLYDDGC